jgi:diguanylate cyclase (GGDEF)-like protein
VAASDNHRRLWRPGFTTRVVVLVGLVGVGTLLAMAIIGYQRITDINSENSAIRIDRAARAATQLAQEATDGGMQVVSDDGGSPVRIDLDLGEKLSPSPMWDDLIDRIAATNQGAANLFVFDPETAAFDRISTSFKRPDGTRAGDSTREPGIIVEGHPAYAAIANGEVHTGPVPVMDRLRLAYLTPIFVEGEVSGALAVDVGWVDDLERINSEVQSQVLVVTVILIVLAGLLGAMLTIGAFRPLRTLARAATRLGRGERVPDMPMKDRPDEIGTLARALGRVDELQADLMHLAYHDDLTGLPNRFDLFMDLDRRIADLDGRTRFAVIQIDLDDFGSINQSLGHHIGDALLVAVGSQLRDRRQAGEHVSRSGGDEFTVVTGPIESLADARDVAERIRAAVEDGSAQAVTFPVTPSIGLVMVPDHAESAAEAIAHAEIALGQAKQQGVGSTAVFEAHMAASASRRRRLTSDLRTVLDEGGLDIHLQPQYDLRSGGLIGMEALARWSHPEFGPIAPPEFIHLAESSGLITELGTQVLERSCAFLAEWLGHGKPTMSISVNVSPIQLWSPGFYESVASALQRHEIPASSLCLEMTESVLADHADRKLRTLLSRIADLGVRLSIDDFGTGYSGLSYLHALPYRELKIDRSFIVDAETSPTQAEIVAAIVTLGHALDMTVIAEGIEDDAGLTFVRSLGCDGAQGYLFARPMPVAEALALDPAPVHDRS